MIFADKPISINSHDLLGRSRFAKILAKSILNLDTAETFTIGLYGKWGSGKTSLVNMTLNEISEQLVNVSEENKLIVVHFEPWNFSDTNQLLSQFFIRLSGEFRSSKDEKLQKIGEAIGTYSDAFSLAESIPHVGKPLSFFARIGMLALSNKLKNGYDEKDVFKQKEYVVKLLGNQKSRVLIVIDDIDRLDNEKIRQVFQLITSVAKFPNTIYLLVFDKEIVIKALQKVQEGSGEDYLEKVIQMPIQLPSIQHDKLKQVLFDRLDEILKHQSGACFQQTHWQHLFGPCIMPFIKSIRDVNRLCNLVQFKLTALSSEVDFADMVAVSALEIALPQIYTWIKHNKSVLTGDYDFSSIGENKSQSEWHGIYYEQIKLALNDTEKEDEQNVELAISFLAHVFPYFGQKIGNVYESHDKNAYLKNNQIAHSKKFDRYFDLDIDNIGLRKAKISEAIQFLNMDELSRYLLTCDKLGLSCDFIEEIQAMIPEISSDRAKVIITALFNTSQKLDSESDRGILSMPASSYANYTILKLFEVVVSEDRLSLFVDVLQNADMISLQSIAIVINMLELGYGRLAANGVERDYAKVISLEELIQLETLFTQEAKEILRKENLFCSCGWGMVFHLLYSLDEEYAKTYLSAALLEDKNIVGYMTSSVEAWHGGGTEYEIRDDYKTYLSEDRILQAINGLRNSGDFFSLPEQMQNKCAAFYLHESESPSHQRRVDQADVDKLLETWKADTIS